MELCKFFYPEMGMTEKPANREQRRAAQSKTVRKSMRRHAQEAKSEEDAERAIANAGKTKQQIVFATLALAMAVPIALYVS